jgi:hypothetical protein
MDVSRLRWTHEGDGEVDGNRTPVASAAAKGRLHMNRSFSTSPIRSQACYRPKCVHSVASYFGAVERSAISATLASDREPILPLPLSLWPSPDAIVAIQNPKR